MFFRTFSRPSTRSAYSLIEVLVVLSIIGILTVLLVPMATGVMRSHQLSTANQTVLGQLNMARQAAVTRGHAVQVRIYFLPNYNEASGTAAPAVYRGMQCFLEGEATSSGTGFVTPLTALTKPIFFTAPVTVLDDTNRSTLLTLASSPPAAGETLPPYGQNFRYISFRFKPSGKADLSDTATGLTLVLQGDATHSNGLPKNFRSIEIDARSGSIRSYSP